MNKHTPAPWFFHPSTGAIVDYKGRILANKVYDDDNGALMANAPKLEADRARLLAALKDVLGAINKARTTKAPAGHYDEDVYYNGIDFAPQIEIASEIVARVEGDTP